MSRKNICQANTNQQKAGMALLISEKTEFRANTLMGYIKSLHNRKVRINQETIRNYKLPCT